MAPSRLHRRPCQKAQISVRLLPKKGGTISAVQKTAKRVIVRIEKSLRRTLSPARGSDYFTTTWVRTWRVR